eukprot:s899_g5.t1
MYIIHVGVILPNCCPTVNPPQSCQLGLRTRQGQPRQQRMQCMAYVDCRRVVLDASSLNGKATIRSELPLLQLLNHPDFEVLRRVRHLGDKTAQQIMSFRRRQGDLKTVSDLHTKVGLREVLVKKVLKEYRVL